MIKRDSFDTMYRLEISQSLCKMILRAKKFKEIEKLFSRTFLDNIVKNGLK